MWGGVKESGQGGKWEKEEGIGGGRGVGIGYGQDKINKENNK